MSVNTNEAVVVFDKESLINDDLHFTNHINYLCRTDEKQKWTNGATKYNGAFLFDYNHEYLAHYKFDSIENINKVRNEISKFSSVYDVKDLRMLRLSWEHEDNEVSLNQMPRDISQLIMVFAKCPFIEPIAIVVHLDQNDHYPHCHFLYKGSGFEEYCYKEVSDNL